MKPETEAFLSLVRDADNPSHVDEERVLRALTASIAASAALSATAVAGRSAFGRTWFAKVSASFGGKLSLVAALSSVGVSAGDTAPAPRDSDVVRVTRVERATLAPPVAPSASVAAEVAPIVAASASTRPRSEPQANTLRAELALLRHVQASLKRGDGSAALRALDAHRTKDRTLLAERSAARILALCQLGLTAEAREDAEEFARRHANSLQREAIANSCANPQRNLEP